MLTFKHAKVEGSFTSNTTPRTHVEDEVICLFCILTKQKWNTLTCRTGSHGIAKIKHKEIFQDVSVSDDFWINPQKHRQQK